MVLDQYFDSLQTKVFEIIAEDWVGFVCVKNKTLAGCIESFLFASKTRPRR